MHVISASRRTDIPAFHSQWFMNRVRSGRVGVVSPFGRKLFEVSLAAEDVLCIVFWTKNAAPMLPELDELSRRGYSFTFLYTINHYPRFLEPRVPGIEATLKTVQTLCERYPGPVLRWRYDTIVLTESLDRNWHLTNFSRLCDLLAPYTTECIFSFCDYYRKTIRNMDRRVPDHVKPDEAQCLDLAGELADKAAARGITLASCAHDFLVSGRIAKARCIDPELLGKLMADPEKKLAVQALKTAPTRKECGCAASRDIGAYDTCVHGCAYCYANTDPERAERNMGLIGPDDYCLDPWHLKTIQAD
jgi:hypothetical protein